jgi:hypothetical protein
MKSFTHSSRLMSLAWAAFFFILTSSNEPALAQSPAELKKGPLKLRTVEAIPGKQPESGPPISDVKITVLDGESSKSKTLWSATTDQRGEVSWPEPIQAKQEDPSLPKKKIFVRASKGGYQSTTRPIEPTAGEETIALSKWVPWMVRAVDAQTKEPIPTFTVMNRMLTNLSTHYGPTTAQNGEALAGFFSEKTIRERELTIEAPGYETFRVALTPVLGTTNTYELKRKPATP